MITTSGAPAARLPRLFCSGISGTQIINKEEMMNAE